MEAFLYRMAEAEPITDSLVTAQFPRPTLGVSGDLAVQVSEDRRRVHAMARSTISVGCTEWSLPNWTESSRRVLLPQGASS